MIKRYLLPALLAALVAGCGGGGESGPAAPKQMQTAKRAVQGAALFHASVDISMNRLRPGRGRDVRR